MEILSGTTSNKLGVASGNLATDLERINSLVGPKFDLVLITGTFNVSLVNSRQSTVIDELIYERSAAETLYFERCRLKWAGCANGVRCLLLRSSLHMNSLFKDTLEIMSSCHLRDSYGLSSNLSVQVEVAGDVEWWRLPNDSL